MLSISPTYVGLLWIRLYPKPNQPDDDALLWKKAVILRAVYTIQDTLS